MNAGTDLHSFFGLHQPAFGPVSQPEGLYRSGLVRPVVLEVLAGSPVVSIRGGSGVGKTSFLRVLAMELQARRIGVAVVETQAATPADVAAVMTQAGGLAAEADPALLLRALWHEGGVRRLVLLCDDAGSLPEETFRYLALLLKLRVTQPITLQLVLVGETGPWPGLEAEDLEPLRAASSASYTTLSLRKDEAAAYLDHRLRQAGQTLEGVMNPAAAMELREQAQCNPRRLDELAQQALLHGYRTGRRRLTARSVRQALLAGGGAASRRGGARFAVIGAAAAVCLVAGAAVLAWRDRGQAPAPVIAMVSPPAPKPPAPAPRQAFLNARMLPVAPEHQPAPVRPPPAVAAPPPAAAQAAKVQPEVPGVGGNPGLVLIAGPHDTMPALYARVYRGLTPPPYATVLAANPAPVRPGALLIFPEPPRGWTRR